MNTIIKTYTIGFFLIKTWLFKYCHIIRIFIKEMSFMFTLSLLQNYIIKPQTCLTIQNLTTHWKFTIFEPTLIQRGTRLQHSLLRSPAPQASGVPWAFAHCSHVDSQIWAKLAHLPDGFRFRSDQDPTVWPPRGMAQPFLPSDPSPMLPRCGGLKVLEGNLFLLCLVHLCVLLGDNHRPGSNEVT